MITDIKEFRAWARGDEPVASGDGEWWTDDTMSNDVKAMIMAICLWDTAETLHALVVHGPVWDGDIPSKTDRGKLFDNGLAVRVIRDGQQGCTGATYFGWDVWKAMKIIAETTRTREWLLEPSHRKQP